MRIQLLFLVLVTVLSMLVPSRSTAAHPREFRQAASDLETIRERTLARLLDGASSDAVEDLVGSLRPDGSWPDVDYHSQQRSRWPTAGHLANVAVLAKAYVSPKSGLRGDPELRAAVLGSLDYWLEHDVQNPNWWWNQIGVPRSLAPVLLMMQEELSPAQRERGLSILRRAKIGMTGQNLVWVTEITARRGLLENDPALVAAAYRRIAEEIRVGTGEGIRADFSFHQHGPCLYNHGYGAAFVADCSRIAAEVAGTPWAFESEKIAVLGSLILDGSRWMARGTASDFGAEGREITRRGQDASYLIAAAEEMLKLPTGREEEFRALVAGTSGGGAAALSGNRHFWCSDMMTHHRKGYYTSARMFSRRIVNTDQPCNSEGLKSHHIADGCNLVMRTGREYRDIFGVWDWHKVPGTTAEQTSALTGSPRRQGERSFVGGVSDGTYGMAAFDFTRDKLAARKSWFFFDDEYVCLGAGITCRSDSPVVTTLNQCVMNGQVVVASDAGARQLDRGDHVLESPAWIWHDRIAYVLLRPERVRLRNDAQRGSWAQINRQYPNRPIAHDVFSCCINHGTQPADARYAYVVVPGIELASIAAYAKRPAVKVLRNDPQLQAVRHERLAVTALAFYKAGGATVDRELTIGVDTPCLMLLRQTPSELAISLSNPENRAGTVCVDVSETLHGEGVHAAPDAAGSRIVVDLPEGMAAGSSVTRVFRRKP